jgi:hypothetical protein
MTIERTTNGAWRVYELIDGYLESRLYMGYTKKEALAEFRAEFKGGKQ